MWLDDIVEFSKYVAFILFFTGVIILTPVYLYEKHTCIRYEQTTGRPTDFSFFGGCYVQSESGWFTLDEYKASILAKEGLSK